MSHNPAWIPLCWTLPKCYVYSKVSQVGTGSSVTSSINWKNIDRTVPFPKPPRITGLCIPLYLPSLAEMFVRGRYQVLLSARMNRTCWAVCYPLVLERLQRVLHPLVTSMASKGQANRKRNLTEAQVKNSVSAVETKVRAIQAAPGGLCSQPPGRITTQNTWKMGNWASDAEHILHRRVEGVSVLCDTALPTSRLWSSHTSYC